MIFFLQPKKRITLRDNVFTKNFVPDRDFFKLCDMDFHPIYNQTMYKNMLWIYRLCRITPNFKTDTENCMKLC
jgi:hypothetical protein